MIIGIGNALLDALVRVNSDEVLTELGLPKGSMQLIDELKRADLNARMHAWSVQMATGGSAGNTILALARMGLPVAFIGKVGNDSYGRFFADNCREAGIVPHLLPISLPTGVASTFISPDGQRTFATYLGAAATLTADDLAPDFFEGHSYLYIEGYLVQNHDLMERAVELAHRAGLKVCLDLASYNIVEADHDFFAYLLEKVDIVFANEEEARAFTGKEAEEALGLLAECCQIAVVKVGKHGAMAQCADEVVHCDAMNVEHVVDTTAAGDFFAGGFLFAHAQGRSLAECLRVGSLLAGHVIQVVGSSLPAETWERIRKEAR